MSVSEKKKLLVRNNKKQYHDLTRVMIQQDIAWNTDLKR